MKALDRPVWSSLITHHAPLAEGGAMARRYQRDVNLFASASDDGAEARRALKALVAPDERVFVLQVPPIVVPCGLKALKRAMGVQMLAETPISPVPAGPGEIVALTDADAPDMLALATMTEPGPFLARTHAMGRFLGIRLDGRLAAMAGERMHMPGFTEVSGVCTHPDFRGQGLARRLSAAVAAAIQARGELPFLHAWQSNQPAIDLYHQLGFRLRAEVNVAVLARQ
ncbi:MAG: GNAT family N-acetyltransferase [Paludibacterium sp.]|uniref:GNAT family N-acetyltransferase n=1 Tax=Paludibacterium sp. TaxID=1917523 RepID=UPI0025F6B967|nr:GNAT family N-acetyltransferase [Paludibacterium sp.]MBV8046155.1 GNAT family N-acetyltransferase [Paludibacterium sp.]MBV8648779.1 GNAT family N-acetyltransferase [Paludibacterium sp.]